MPPLVIATLVILAAAWYAGLLVILIRRRMNSSNDSQQFAQREDLLLAGASEQVASRLASGDKIGAIAVYRQEMNPLGLREAKIAVDTFLIDARARALIGAGVSEHVARLLAEGDRIRAIKAYKEASGVTLREAKEAIDVMLAPHT